MTIIQKVHWHNISVTSITRMYLISKSFSLHDKSIAVLFILPHGTMHYRRVSYFNLENGFPIFNLFWQINLLYIYENSISCNIQVFLPFIAPINFYNKVWFWKLNFHITVKIKFRSHYYLDFDWLLFLLLIRCFNSQRVFSFTSKFF